MKKDRILIVCMYFVVGLFIRSTLEFIGIDIISIPAFLIVLITFIITVIIENKIIKNTKED